MVLDDDIEGTSNYKLSYMWRTQQSREMSDVSVNCQATPTPCL